MTRRLKQALAKLSAEQQQVTAWREGAALLLAGPGSGKTHVLACRAANLLTSMHGTTSGVLAVTFTNRAADELRSRVRHFAPRTSNRLTSRTFHSLCLDSLRNYGSRINISPSFSILTDEKERLALISHLRKHSRDKYTPSRTILHQIDYYKANNINPNKLYGEVATIYGKYENYLTESNKLDMNSLVTKAIVLFGDHPTLLAQYQSHYPYWLIDEFQDTTVAQYKLLQTLSSNGFENILSAGDPNQNIFGWSGSTPKNILRFHSDYSAKIFQLKKNYRSSSEIIRYTSKLILNNRHGMRQITEEPNDRSPPKDTDDVRVFCFDHEDDEISFVTEEIAKYGRSFWGKIAIVARTNNLIDNAKYALDKRGVNTFIHKRRTRFLTSEFRWLISTLQLVVDPQNVYVFKSLLRDFDEFAGTRFHSKEFRTIDLSKSGLLIRDWLDVAGRTSVAGWVEMLLKQIRQILDQQHDVLERIDQVVTTLAHYPEGFSVSENFHTDLAVWKELTTKLQIHHEPPLDLPQFVRYMSVRSKTPSTPPHTVSLMTIHSAKGCEYPMVYILGCAEGIMPHHRATSLEEERRICYVALSRATKALTLCFSEQYYGRWLKPQSRFITEMGLEAKEPSVDIVLGAMGAPIDDERYCFDPEDFEQEWSSFLEYVNHHSELEIRSGLGEDVVFHGRVIGQYVAEFRRDGRCVYLVDSVAENRESLGRALSKDGHGVVQVRVPTAGDEENILAELHQILDKF